MHGRMHPNYWQITILLVVDLCSSLAYFMMAQPLPIAGKLPIKTLVAKQLPTTSYIGPLSLKQENIMMTMKGFTQMQRGHPDDALGCNRRTGGC